MPVRTTIVATNDLIDANLLNAVYGAWNAYTPTVSQGATTDIAKTVTYAKYRQAGKTVDGQVSLVVTGSGTAGFAVQVTLPCPTR